MQRIMTAVLLAAVLETPPIGAMELERLWVYCSFNLWVDRNIDALEEVMRRAAAAGYNGILLADSKFSRLEDMDARYFRNVERLKKLASELKLDIVPAVFPVGYSESILWHDPNLAEGQPVRGAPFEVRGGAARLVPDRRELRQPDWKDDIVAADGGAWRVSDPSGRNARVVFKLKVAPHRQYHVAVDIRTEEFRGTPEIKALAGGRSLQYAGLGVKPTQDWKTHHAVFNSLEYEEVGIYLGCWDGRSGSLWWRNPVFEEVGLLNLLRREGTPLSVELGGRALVEGKDYEPVADPRMGVIPWKGGYEIWHEPPAIRCALPDGARLSVSYYHPAIIHDGQVAICPSEPRTMELLRDQARRVHAAFGARGYFMSHDEIRSLNTDLACARRGLDAGAILAANAKGCVEILRAVNPGGEILVWSDMFDPHHNARKDYYLVRGDLTGSWEGLDRGVIIANWHFGEREKSLGWFAERGHRQIIAGYYDAPPEEVRKWLDAASRVRGVIGVMYTTWRANYSDLERFAEIIRSYRPPGSSRTTR